MTSSSSFGPLQSSSPSLLPMQIQAFSAQTTRLIHVIEKSQTKLFESNYRAYMQMYADLKLSLAPAILSSEKAVGTPSHLSEQAGLYMARAKQMNALVKQTLKKHSSVIFYLSATPTDINDCKRFWNTYKTLYSKTPLPKPLSDDAKLEYDPESKRYILPEALTAPLLEAQQQSLAYTQTYYLLKSSLKVLLQSPLNRKTTKKIHSNLKQLHRDSTRRLHLEKSLKSPFLETITLSAMSQQIHRSVRNEQAHAIQSAICKRQKTLPPLSSTLFEMIQIPLKSGNVLLAEWMAAHVSQDASWEKGIEQMAIGSLCIDNDFEKAHEILITHLPDSDIRLSAELALLEEL
ncbi:MAG: hypothetical protein K2P51_03215, partial [Rhabdochlamydiaceae bacterium]|nr:hypothetical protein [Rhabdochlamydiaceae bacterium]